MGVKVKNKSLAQPALKLIFTNYPLETFVGKEAPAVPICQEIRDHIIGLAI